ncbi:DUF4197 family protein [uncultured Croceicoccus sp.]|uniref:DUF4197 family protein n=1 Tax=uncultured Croceicoccus sp. TaxID=1295329 RepID=UPI00262ADCFC|nr:DUF4197 family protein [uncultured Croceicoccus sp.]
MEMTTTPASRRRFIGLSMMGAAAMTLPGCASYGGFSLDEAIRRLLTISSVNAFDRMLAPGGFYDTQIASLDLGTMLGGVRGGAVERILGSSLVRDRMARALYDVAADGAAAAAPAVADAIRVVGIRNAIDLIRGGDTAATGFLRASMGRRLIDVMLPEVRDAMRIIDDPLLGPALSDLAGVDIQRVTGRFTDEVENTIWTQIGREEAYIRENPDSTNDPLIRRVFGLNDLGDAVL